VDGPRAAPDCGSRPDCSCSSMESNDGKNDNNPRADLQEIRRLGDFVGGCVMGFKPFLVDAVLLDI